ncbi:MAG: NAD(P)H-hydrate epimerase, partial [Candidatus Firestonebacteria bacterium]|nr:NAD(P)H-hydrate epimerase [Candidatus Firestonebacteria bacterium]
MYLTTNEQMQELDKFTIEKIGIHGIVLMENAGLKISEIISNKYLNKQITSDVYILCGTGNNGGDGLVAARHLLNNSNNNIIVAIIGNPGKFKNEALANYEIIKKLTNKIFIVEKKEDIKHFSNHIKNSDLIIDAIFGTGLLREVGGIAKNVIDFINSLNKKVISIDIPSGISASTGEVLGTAIRASHTITLALPKRGLFLFPGIEYTGEVSVVDISIPYYKIDNDIKTHILLWEEAKKILPLRPKQAHKGNFGKIFVLAGSRDFVGAPFLTSKAVLKTGAGLVYVGLPEDLFKLTAKKFIEQIPVPLPETEKGTISGKSFTIINEKINKN